MAVVGAHRESELYLRSCALSFSRYRLAFAQHPAPEPPPAIPNFADAKPEIVELVVEDQWDRCNDILGEKHEVAGCMMKPIMAEHDAKRHVAARQLLAAGKITTGREHFLVALLFQHSNDASDLMLAHVVAVTAATKDFARARWMAAATMDRYLQNIHQPQIFGTQFRMEAGNWTQEPYARELISDALRSEWCVVPVAEQDKGLEAYRSGKGSTSTSTSVCQ